MEDLDRTIHSYLWGLVEQHVEQPVNDKECNYYPHTLIIFSSGCLNLSLILAMRFARASFAAFTSAHVSTMSRWAVFCIWMRRMRWI